jgi:hypothetical protein
MPQFTLSPLDSLNLAFAFEIVPLENELVELSTSAAPGLQALASAADAVGSLDPAARRLFILYVNPEKYDWVRPAAAQATPAQGMVFPDDTGFAIQMLRMSGRFGAKRRIAHNRYGAKDVLSGKEQFLELAAFITDYQDLRAEGVPVEFRFHAFAYGDHYACIVPRLTMSKNQRTRIGSPQYQLQMQSFRRLDQADIPVSFFETGPFGFMSDIVEFASDVVDSATITVAELRTLISLPRRLVAEVNPLLESVELLLDEIAGAHTEFEALRNLSFPEIRRVEQQAEQAGDLFEEVLHAETDDSTDTRTAYSSLRSLEQALSHLGGVASTVTTRGARAERWGRQVALDVTVSNEAAADLADAMAPDGTAADGAPLESVTARRLRAGGLGRLGLSELQLATILARTAQYRGWVPYLLSDGETPYSVASAQYGDVSRWVDIVLVNDLAPPFFGEAPGAAAPGDIIRLPIFGPGPSIPFDVSVEDLPEFNIEIERRIFGVDFEIAETGGVLDFVVDAGADNLDWSLVEGFPCFQQRLQKLVMRVERGSLILFPRFGVVYRLGHANQPDHNVLLLLALREAILGESAVRRIRDESVTQEGTATVVEFKVDTFAAGPVKIRRTL